MSEDLRRETASWPGPWANQGFVYPMLYVRSFFFLGEIAEKKGEKAAARGYYERFLKYWKDGDTDRDRVAEAERRLKNL